MKLSPEIAEALTHLRGNRDFDTVLKGMSEHEAEETQRCIEHDGPIQLRASGAVKTLQLWKNFYRDAPAALEKFKSTLPQKR